LTPFRVPVGELDTGLPLGLGVFSYPQCTVTLTLGTKLLLYTDGITEAMDSMEEEYGSARLIEHFLRPGACVDGLIAEVQRFGAGSGEPTMQPPFESAAAKQDRAVGGTPNR
jgi:sigma-B regulation protein RsbU (phosphoserine phosphatase)